MGTRLYIGNLPYSMTDADLHDLFSSAGPVKAAEVIRDRDTGQSKGFGFVEMENQEGADEALRTLNGTSFQNRQIRVDEARPRETRSNDRGGYGGGGGGSRSGGSRSSSGGSRSGGSRGSSSYDKGGRY